MRNPRDLLRRLMIYYARDYELLCPYQLGDTIYDVYAAYSHYHCFEHAFIRSTLTLSRTDLEHFTEQIIAISQTEQSYHEIFRKLNITRIEFDSLKSSSFYELKKK